MNNNLIVTFQLFAKQMFAFKVVINNTKALIDYLSIFVMPLSLIFICIVCESAILYPFVLMKLLQMKWQLQQMKPAVIGNMGVYS